MLLASLLVWGLLQPYTLERRQETAVIPGLPTVVFLLKPLHNAGIPTFAILGNHDYVLSKRSAPPRNELAAAVESALEEQGFPTLINEAVPVERDGGEPLFIVGLGSYYARNDLPRQALDNVPTTAARVVMMHHPESFPKLAAGTAPLAVAGHTHGG